MFFYVYRIDDLTTGEYYFGSRKSKVKPKQDNKYLGSPKVWDINENHTIIKTIIAEGFKTRREALKFEGQIISKYINDPLNRNYAIPHENQVKFFGGSRYGSDNSFFGKTHSIEFKTKMSKIRKKEYKGTGNPMYGKKHSESSKRLMSLKKADIYNGSNNPMAKKIFQYDLNLNLINSWDCAKDCIQYYEKTGINISKGNLSSASKHNTNSPNKYKTVKGFIFAFEQINLK